MFGQLRGEKDIELDVEIALAVGLRHSFARNFLQN